jgi:hypothetical protein
VSGFSRTDVEHALVAVERKSREHDCAPVELRVGDSVIRLGVPLAHETFSGRINSVQQRATRLRPLTAGQEQRLKALKHMSRLLDSAFVLPGTQIRIGLDPILGLVPGLGDLVSPLFAIAMLWQGRDLGIPRVVQLRMIFNVAIDALVGMLPIAGDIFDFAWKANDRNYALLERHAYEHRRPTTGDWLFVTGLIALLLVIAAVPFLLAGWLITGVGSHL